MPVDLIERPDFSNRENVATAVHESAHAHAIQAVGGRVRGCQVYVAGGGRTNWDRPRDLALEQQALVALAGPAAEARYLTPRGIRSTKLREMQPFVSPEDYEMLQSAICEAAPNDFMRQSELYWQMVRRAEAFARSDWNPIVRLAKRMIANGGVYIAEAAPPAPLNPADDPRLLAAMNMLWGDGAVYP